MESNHIEEIKTWQVPSDTNPAVKYTVAFYTDGSFTCTCPTFKRRASRHSETRTCHHIRTFMEVYRLRDIDTQISNAPAKRKRHLTTVED